MKTTGARSPNASQADFHIILFGLIVFSLSSCSPALILVLQFHLIILLILMASLFSSLCKALGCVLKTAVNVNFVAIQVSLLE